MCTLSWCARPSSGYLLFFNRDELRQRQPATPPEIIHGESRSFVCARDGRAGGTWLLTNDGGLTIAILNHYAATASKPVGPPGESRGKLVMALAECANIAEFREHMGTLQPDGIYRPFLLFAIERDLGSSLWCWDGERCHEKMPPHPAILTTSSFRSEEVRQHRQGLRQRLATNLEASDLGRMHQFHDPAKPAHSIRMRRDDAMTVALCQLEVSPDQACYRYRAESAEHLNLGLVAEVCLPLIEAGS